MTERMICLASLVIGYGFGLLQIAQIYSKSKNVDIRKKNSIQLLHFPLLYGFPIFECTNFLNCSFVVIFFNINIVCIKNNLTVKNVITNKYKIVNSEGRQYNNIILVFESIVLNLS